MANKLDIFKCGVCGNIVELLHVGGGELVCCNQPMNLLEAKSADAATEKHVPVVEKAANGIKVKVGSVPHPMEDKHYIEWIAVYGANNIMRKFLKPGEKPEAEFASQDAGAKAKEYCNVHGLWKNK